LILLGFLEFDGQKAGYFREDLRCFCLGHARFQEDLRFFALTCRGARIFVVAKLELPRVVVGWLSGWVDGDRSAR
jgi:hypothetical protein